MDDLSKLNLAGLDLSLLGQGGEAPSAPEPEAIPPELVICERPLPLPAPAEAPAGEVAAWLAQRLGGMRGRLTQVEVELERQRRAAEEFRTKSLLRAVELGDLLDDVAASLVHPGPGRERSVKARQVRELALERLEMLAKALRNEVLAPLGVEQRLVQPGQAVDGERDQVLDTVDDPSLAPGVVARVVRKAYYDREGGTYVRRAVVMATAAQAKQR